MASYVESGNIGYFIDMEKLRKRVERGEKFSDALESLIGIEIGGADVMALLIAYRDWLGESGEGQ